MNVSETKHLAMQKKEHPKDLLRKFAPTQLSINQEKKNDKPDINLGLSLSLGGIYCENSNEKTLSRSSSSIGMMTLKKDGDAKERDSLFPRSFLSLSRSYSVPTEAEQEQRKATLMALARTRIESTENFMWDRAQNGGTYEQEKSLAKEPRPSSPSQVAAWAAASAAKSPALCRALVQIKRQASMYSSRRLEGQEGLAAGNGANHSQLLLTQKDTESKLMVGANANERLVKAAETKIKNPSKRAKLLKNGFQDRGMDVMKQMPSVTTTGNGPYGRKIEGILYKYSKSQVTIVCVCHGSFLSPAEFVRHAGGNNVANPMKHITVCSSFSF
ncbi:ninja-family protein AFP3 isoform X2 [Ricinus communis]|uniref:ninja-family protein AFP3 isoform X2 n=1 Tax=Ricinus communis TaxID=3988 RepID=UPI0007728C0C|nr:ninja-family protein AFP3 isoform X2 [Ricinus communis]|eukprot:XP_015572092.1 ninja-family protein AFP3 isoform X2 [Ricinus communis]